MGYNSMDNGWCKFTHYRIPRENLLSRFAYVDKDGAFEMRGDPKLLYQIMLQTRITLLNAASSAVARSILIATRYAVCRR